MNRFTVSTFAVFTVRIFTQKGLFDEYRISYNYDKWLADD